MVLGGGKMQNFFCAPRREFCPPLEKLLATPLVALQPPNKYEIENENIVSQNVSAFSATAGASIFLEITHKDHKFSLRSS